MQVAKTQNLSIFAKPSQSYVCPNVSVGKRSYKIVKAIHYLWYIIRLGDTYILLHLCLIDRITTCCSSVGFYSV